MADDNATPTTEGEPGRDVPLSLLASEMFGSDFHGEVSKGEAEKPAPAEEEAPEAETEEAAAGEGETGKEQEKPEGETEAITSSSLQELIEANEWDPEWVNALKVSVKVDGKPGEATVKDLVDSYQMRQAAEHRLEEAKAKAK